MESEKPKLFVANLKSEFTENHLSSYFSKYGKVTEALVIRYKGTSISKGFGFVTFDDPAVAAAVLDEGNHMILEQKVCVKTAIPKNQQRVHENYGNRENDNSNSGGDDENNNGHAENNDNFMDNNGDHARFSRKRIFAGGLPQNITKEELGAFFETFGAITDVCVILNQETRRPRGFGFVTFASEETAATVLKNKFYELNNHYVEVKRAEPKLKNPGTNVELRDVSGHQYRYYKVYWPIWCPNYHIYVPHPYASQYSIYYAQFSWNHLDYNGGENRTNYYGTRWYR